MTVICTTFASGLWLTDNPDAATSGEMPFPAFAIASLTNDQLLIMSR